MGKGRNKNKKLKVTHIQGRRFSGVHKIKIILGGQFVYRGKIFDAHDFPYNGNINLENSNVLPSGSYVNDKEKHKKAKKKRLSKSRKAWLYTNIKDCPDAKEICKGS